MPLRGDCLLPISQGVALGWGLIAPSGRYRMHSDYHSQKFMTNYMKFIDNYMVIICFLLFYVVLCCFCCLNVVQRSRDVPLGRLPSKRSSLAKLLSKTPSLRQISWVLFVIVAKKGFVSHIIETKNSKKVAKREYPAYLCDVERKKETSPRQKQIDNNNNKKIRL